jgi:CheY-like chemotaxis protein
MTPPEQPLKESEPVSAYFDDCLFKPIARSRLFDCLDNALGRLESLNAKPFPYSASRPPFSAGSRSTQLRILLAEDNRVNQKVALGLLKKVGFVADVASNGIEVLDALQRSPYDIVFMDWQMPEMDGTEATRMIRQRECDQSCECPWETPMYIVAMTANAMEGDREKCLASGMNDYLSKPVRLPDLVAALQRWKPAS